MKKGLVLFGLLALFSFVFIGNVAAQELTPGINYSVSCQDDTDCKLEVPSKLLECSLCDKYGCNNYHVSSSDVVAVNINWTPDCSWQEVPEDGWGCAACVGSISGEGYEAKCVNSTCEKVFVNVPDEVECSSEGEMCGGIAAFACCSGLTCVIEGDYPDAAGACVSDGIEVCDDLCGDGECQNLVCQGSGCPCAETRESCSEDCGLIDIGGGEQEGGRSWLWIFLVVLIIIILIIIGLKIAKWLIWAVVIAAAIAALLWIFVF